MGSGSRHEQVGNREENPQVAGPHDASALCGTDHHRLTLVNAQALVDAAISNSIDPGRYGVVKSHERSDTEIKFTYSGGPTVSINLRNAGTRQKGPDTDRINWLYKLHYIQWTGDA